MITLPDGVFKFSTKEYINHENVSSKLILPLNKIQGKDTSLIHQVEIYGNQITSSVEDNFWVQCERNKSFILFEREQLTFIIWRQAIFLGREIVHSCISNFFHTNLKKLILKFEY